MIYNISGRKHKLILILNLSFQSFTLIIQLISLELAVQKKIFIFLKQFFEGRHFRQLFHATLTLLRNATGDLQ